MLWSLLLGQALFAQKPFTQIQCEAPQLGYYWEAPEGATYPRQHEGDGFLFEVLHQVHPAIQEDHLMVVQYSLPAKEWMYSWSFQSSQFFGSKHEFVTEYQGQLMLCRLTKVAQ